MTFTITIPLWLPAAYLAIGAVLWLPLEYRHWRSIQEIDRTTFWRDLWPDFKRRWWVPLAVTVAWPLAVYEEVR